MQIAEKRYPVSARDYRLCEEVGEGVSATVYRAICIPRDEVVAIKVLDLEKCNNDLVCNLFALFFSPQLQFFLNFFIIVNILVGASHYYAFLSNFAIITWKLSSGCFCRYYCRLWFKAL